MMMGEGNVISWFVSYLFDGLIMINFLKLFLHHTQEREIWLKIKWTKQIDTHCVCSEVRYVKKDEKDYFLWRMINRNENIHYKGLFMPAYSKRDDNFHLIQILYLNLHKTNFHPLENKGNESMSIFSHYCSIGSEMKLDILS